MTLRAAGRIAVITQSQYPVEVRARRMAEACAAHGYAVDVYCLQKPGELPEETLRGVQIHRLPMFRRQGAPASTYIAEYTRFLAAVGARLGRRPMRAQYDAIQVYNPPDLLAFATVAPRLFHGTRVLLDIRDVAPELYMSRFGKGHGHWMTRVLRMQEALSCRYAHAVTVCTTYVYDLLARRGLDRRKMTIVMNCPDDAIFDAPAVTPHARFEAGAVDCPYRIVYHGGMLERYGPDLLVRAAPALKAAIPNLSIDLYGAGDFLPVVAGLVQELGVQDAVHVHGFVATDAIPPILAQASIGVVPMRRDIFTDGLLPTKLMELARAGVPAVVARTHTTASYFPDDMVAYFAPGDVEDMTAQVLRLYRHPLQARALAAQARTFEDRYNWRTESARYVALVDRLLA